MSVAGRKTSNSLVATATTKMDIEEFSFQWKIDLGSSSWLKTRGLPIQSPLFTGGNRLKYSWQLKLTVESSSTCNLRFTLVSASGTDSLKEFEVNATAFASFKGASEALTEGSTSFEKIGNDWGDNSPSIDIQFYHIYTNAKEYIQDNVLTFYCVIVMGSGIYHSQAFPQTPNSSDTVVSSLRTAMKSGEFSDLTIITKTKKIRAHKFILAAQSPVFAAMFRSKMQEAKNNSVQIKDFDDNIVDAMIEYMYTGVTELSTQKVHSLDLLRISDKYELLDLKSSLAKFLKSSVELENAVELLVLAFLHNCDALKTAAMDFIIRNEREMTETDSFKNLAISHPKMLMDLYLAN